MWCRAVWRCVEGKTIIDIKNWRDHVLDAQLSLAHAQAQNVTRADAITHLYQAVVEITQAMKKLETRDDD